MWADGREPVSYNQLRIKAMRIVPSTIWSGVVMALLIPAAFFAYEYSIERKAPYVTLTPFKRTRNPLTLLPEMLNGGARYWVGRTQVVELLPKLLIDAVDRAVKAPTC
jgi:hypothetical protein